MVVAAVGAVSYPSMNLDDCSCQPKCTPDLFIAFSPVSQRPDQLTVHDNSLHVGSVTEEEYSFASLGNLRRLPELAKQYSSTLAKPLAILAT